MSTQPACCADPSHPKDVPCACGARSAECACSKAAQPEAPTACGGSCCGGKKDEEVRDLVKEYYGKTLKSNDDLKTCACTSQSRPPPHIAAVIAELHEDVVSHYYGCGLTIPTTLDGLVAVDLGSGSGRDCFILSKLVGPRGFVHGIDMTDEQLAIARRTIDYHTKKFGYAKPNVEFHKGYIERLTMLQDNSVDLIISNCVINLSPDKQSVLNEAHRVLRRGGELYFSDVYCDRRVPPEVSSDPVLYGECLGGALYWNDFMRAARRAGFGDPRLVEDHPIVATTAPVAKKLAGYKFWSATFRLFKIDELESECEDYGQAVIYKGTVPEMPIEFKLDAHHVMEAGKVFPVCRNTWMMLHETRLAPHFEFIGSGDKHFGIFSACGKGVPFTSQQEGDSNASACCSSSKKGSCCC